VVSRGIMVSGDASQVLGGASQAPAVWNGWPSRKPIPATEDHVTQPVGPRVVLPMPPRPAQRRPRIPFSSDADGMR
jgi:hypothetical protein